MLLSMLDFGITQILYNLLLLIPILLISLTVHEVCHGYAASLLGDQTARNFGRLSLNPIKHIDPFGAIMLLLFGFGWAKPVPINIRYFKKPKRDIVIVSLAGPFSNFVLAFFGALIYLISSKFYDASPLWLTASEFFYLFTNINIGLGVFNLIPIPPLDGSRLISVIIPKKLAVKFFAYERYIQIILLLLLWRGVFDAPLLWLRREVLELFCNFWLMLPLFG